MRSILLIFLCLFISNTEVNAQGCVAIKGTAGVCSRPSDAKGWDLNLNNRHFRSYKHFVGDKEQKHRIENGSNVINYAYELNITVTRTLNSRLSVAATLPIMAFSRSSLYEHYQQTRHRTGSFGIGDARISVYRWMLDPKKSHKGNIQLGLGIKLPTGNYNYQDYFYKKADSMVLAPVDQSIQPGDGGTGFSFEMNSFYNFSHKVGVYGSFFYLVNPREVNGTSTTRGSATSATAKKYNTDVMSVPDLFMARAGASYTFKKFTFSGGVRIEGLPSSDLVGGDRGFRRPGYIISAEPAVIYVFKKTSFNLSVPFALKRNRTQSDSDKRRTADTGIHQQGDAAFADYLISAGVTFNF
jgi:hypothetical protein